MILADKILMLRKKNGWSQEELAEKLNVSRQSVSKWESASSIPDIGKILEMARFFGVTTDFLLKDTMEAPEYCGEEMEGPRRVSLQEANDFMRSRADIGKRMALGVAMCILSPVPLILLLGISQEKPWGMELDAGLASGIGLVTLLLMVASAVAVFILCGMGMKRFEYLSKCEFELEYGVAGVVGENWREFEGRFTRSVVTGVVLCILSPLPLIIAALLNAPGMVILALVALLLALVAAAVYLFITVGMVKSSFDQLRMEGEFDRTEAKNSRRTEKFGAFYWPIVTAIYLGWSFLADGWRITWVIWPVGALVFAGIAALLRRES